MSGLAVLSSLSVCCAADTQRDHGFVFPVSSTPFTTYKGHDAFYGEAYTLNNQAVIGLSKRLDLELAPFKNSALAREIYLVLSAGAHLKNAAETGYVLDLHSWLRVFVDDWKALKEKWSEAGMTTPCPDFDGDAVLATKYLEWSRARTQESCQIIDTCGYSEAV